MWAWKPGGPASPFPGQASPCQEGAQQASSGLMQREQRLSGKCTGWHVRMAAAKEVLMPTPSRSRPERWDKSHIPISQMKHLRLREGTALPRSFSGLVAEPDFKLRPPGPASPNKKASLVSKVHTVLAVLLALLSVMSDCQCPVRSHARHCQALTHLIFIFRHPRSPIGQVSKHQPRSSSRDIGELGFEPESV